MESDFDLKGSNKKKKDLRRNKTFKRLKSVNKIDENRSITKDLKKIKMRRKRKERIVASLYCT